MVIIGSSVSLLQDLYRYRSEGVQNEQLAYIYPLTGYSAVLILMLKIILI
jgi:hypothetical protein